MLARQKMFDDKEGYGVEPVLHDWVELHLLKLVKGVDSV